jgi:sodium/proline symporter
VEHGTAVLLTLIVYNVTLVSIGLWSQRRTHDGVDYFLGGRRLGAWVASISASASSSSAWTLLAVSGAAFQFGVSALWLFPACVSGFLINWFVLAPRLRRLPAAADAVTVTDVVTGGLPGSEHRPGDAVTRLNVWVASAIVLFCFSVYVGSQFHAAGKTFSDTFAMDEGRAILVGGAVVLLYTFLGGFWAVSVTDTFQGLLMALTAVLLPIAALWEVGGPGALIEGMRAVPIEHYMSWTRDFTGVAALGFVLGTLGIGLGYPGQPHVVNRFMALRGGVDELRRARLIAIGWAIVVYAGMLLLGLCGRVLFGELGDQETVFVRVSNELFPPVVAGVMVAAVLSAIMSTADSQLLVAASSVTHDLRFGGPSARVMLRRSRMIVTIIGIIAIVIALVMIRHKRIFDSVLFAWSALGAAFGPLALVTVFRGPRPPLCVLCTMTAGFAASVVASSTISSPGKVLDNVAPFLLALVIALLPSRLAARGAERTPPLFRCRMERSTVGAGAGMCVARFARSRSIPHERPCAPRTDVRRRVRAFFALLERLVVRRALGQCAIKAP